MTIWFPNSRGSDSRARWIVCCDTGGPSSRRKGAIPPCIPDEDSQGGPLKATETRFLRRSREKLHGAAGRNVGESLKSLGVQTSDFSVYYDLVQALRARGIPFIPLAAEEEIPIHVAVVLTTAAEAARVTHGRVVVYTNPEATLDEALRLLDGHEAFRQCVIGVDPGERPGVAVLADGRVVRLVHAANPKRSAPRSTRPWPAAPPDASWSASATAPPRTATASSAR